MTKAHNSWEVETFAFALDKTTTSWRHSKFPLKPEWKLCFISIRSRLRLVTLPDSLRCHRIARTLQHCRSSVTTVSSLFHGEHWKVRKLSWAHFRWWCAAVVKVELFWVSFHHVNFETFQCQEMLQVRRRKLCYFSISLTLFLLFLVIIIILGKRKL